ncbi:MAG: hypothetical protein ACOC4H_03215, partial [bacterium]
MEWIRGVFSFKRLAVCAGAALIGLMPLFAYASEKTEKSRELAKTSTDIIAYDPAEKVFIYRQKSKKIKNDADENLRNYGKYREIGPVKEFEIPARQILKAAGETGKKPDVSAHIKASSFTEKVNEKLIRVSLNDKEDGLWYRLKAEIPEGRRVLRIVRDDGVEIINTEYID